MPVSAALAPAACSGRAGGPAPARKVSGQPQQCSADLSLEAQLPLATTVTTIGQAYYCVFARYFEQSLVGLPAGETGRGIRALVLGSHDPCLVCTTQ